MTRGVDQLSDWAAVQEGNTGHGRLHLRCTNDVAVQIERRLGDALAPRLPVREQDRGEWTHRYPMHRALSGDEVGFIELLTKVLTLRLGAPVSVGIALDYYKDPSSHEDPQHWVNTRIGELVHQGKYLDVDAAGAELSKELAQFMDRHPDLQRAEVIVNVPSHSERRFSERLAAAVGRIRGIAVVTMKDDAQVPIKDTDPADRPSRTYSVDRDAVNGKRVVVIDDVSRTGESLRSAAQHVMAAGARDVSVLVAVRTMRN